MFDSKTMGIDLGTLIFFNMISLFLCIWFMN